jgi:hypothetical protein
MDRAALATLNTLNALASGLAKVPGPKTIVFLSDGFIVERSETNLRQVVGQTARAGARVYALDVRGLNRGRNAGMIDQLAVDDPAGAPTQFDALVDGVSSLSVDTGGLLIRNENNLGRALDRIARDAGTYYVLGYQPVNAAFDGRFRSIDVRVKRAGLRVRARRGYVALEPARMLGPQPLRAIGNAASRNMEAPGSPTGAPTPPVAVPSPEPLPSLSSPVLGSVVDRGVVPSDAIRLRPGAAERVREIAAGRTGSDGDLSAQGWKAYERGDVETAAALLTRAAAQPDVRPWVLYTLGLSQYALGHPLDAAASWERVRLSAPEFDAVYIDLADAYIQSADLTKALEVLRDGSRRWPSNPEFHNAIGVLHVRRGALDEGIAAFTRAAAAAPDDPLAYFNLGRAYELRYARSHRYVSSQGRWTFSDSDRRKAAESYEQCLRLGGPYVQAATESLRRLEWSR